MLVFSARMSPYLATRCPEKNINATQITNLSQTKIHFSCFYSDTLIVAILKVNIAGMWQYLTQKTLFPGFDYNFHFDAING